MSSRWKARSISRDFRRPTALGTTRREQIALGLAASQDLQGFRRQVCSILPAIQPNVWGRMSKITIIAAFRDLIGFGSKGANARELPRFARWIRSRACSRPGRADSATGVVASDPHCRPNQTVPLPRLSPPSSLARENWKPLSSEGIVTAVRRIPKRHRLVRRDVSPLLGD